MTDSFSRAVQTHSPAIETALDALLAREEPVANLHDGVRYALGLDLGTTRERGKRLRPVLCVATAEVLGAPPEHALPFAAAIELMHNFALVHDDIEDGDPVRRDRPATHIRWGLAHGINIGDYLHCKVWSTLLQQTDLAPETHLRLLRLMSETLDHTHVGQALDMNARTTRPFTHEQYWRLVREKTGYYLAAPILGGAIVAGADDATLDAIRAYGNLVGPLYQLTDDLIDLTHGKGRGGAIGSDIREGKRSFLVAEVTPLLDDATRERLYDILDAAREATTDNDVAWVIEAFERHGIAERAAREAQRLLDEALATTAGMPSALGTLLADFARLVSKRTR